RPAGCDGDSARSGADGAAGSGAAARPAGRPLGPDSQGADADPAATPRLRRARTGRDRLSTSWVLSCCPALLPHALRDNRRDVGDATDCGEPGIRRAGVPAFQFDDCGCDPENRTVLADKPLGRLTALRHGRPSRQWFRRTWPERWT